MTSKQGSVQDEIFILITITLHSMKFLKLQEKETAEELNMAEENFEKTLLCLYSMHK